MIHSVPLLCFQRCPGGNQFYEGEFVMRRKKLVSTLLCATVLTASLTIGAAAATPEDHIYRETMPPVPGHRS